MLAVDVRTGGDPRADLEAGVAATPGRDFDPERGHRYLRFSFAGAEADIAEAGRRLAAWRHMSA